MAPPKQADTGRLPTLADLDTLPPGVVGEIIEGVLYTMTKPRMPHQLLGLEIGSDLLGPFGRGRGGPGGWWIVTEPGIERPDNTVEISLDVGGWRRERMPKAPRKRAIDVVPDWVCEIRRRPRGAMISSTRCRTTRRSAHPARGSSISKHAR